MKLQFSGGPGVARMMQGEMFLECGDNSPLWIATKWRGCGSTWNGGVVDGLLRADGLRYSPAFMLLRRGIPSRSKAVIALRSITALQKDYKQ